MIDEEFKKIKGYVNYSVSNFGNVRNDITNELEVIKLCKEGYLTVKMRGCRNTYKERVHRLVAKAFINNLENHKNVRHLDKNKLNNHVNNLEWYSYYSNKN